MVSLEVSPVLFVLLVSAASHGAPWGYQDVNALNPSVWSSASLSSGDLDQDGDADLLSVSEYETYIYANVGGVLNPGVVRPNVPNTFRSQTSTTMVTSMWSTALRTSAGTPTMASAVLGPR